MVYTLDQAALAGTAIANSEGDSVGRVKASVVDSCRLDDTD